MPHRSLRLLTLPPQPAQGGERGGLLLRERSSSSPPDAHSGGPGGQDPRGRESEGREENPFAPPPEGTPDRPWQPRHPSPGEGSGDGPGDGAGDGSRGGAPWGSRWSDRQPGRSGGGFGERPRPDQEDGSGGPGGGRPGSGMRWDPTDPAQRRARYALLSGMWAFFFALFGWPYVALMLGALALYWGIDSLRTRPRTPDPDRPAPETPGRSHTTSAVAGLVTASLALLLVAASFTAQLVYQDYYTCTKDALTAEAEQSCSELLPKELRGVLGAES
ncbi:hypothetical protein [Streptomyces sp. NPDC053367]|uniref:hypothetical protein n=1 Tax=Streptomyces sp. NPDC053367 TaxID=3365700 RepID=UPI0037D797AD